MSRFGGLPVAEHSKARDKHSQSHDQVEREFQDPKGEWRRLFSEFLGTFLTTVVIVGAHAVAAQSGGKVTDAMGFIARGLMTMGAILFMGSVSGAQLNPAVTLAFALRNNFPWARVPGYLIVQLIGAIGAAVVIWALFGNLVSEGATTPGKGLSNWQALGIEVLLTAGLTSTILGTAHNARNMGTNAAIAVGGYIILAGFWAGPASGASMNPFRSLAPDLLRGDLSTTWIYFAGPAIGVVIGVAFEWLLKGPPSPAGDVAAQGEEK